MEEDRSVLVTGAGGFIGGHLVKDLLQKNYKVRAVDIKPFNEWWQLHIEAENEVADLKDLDNCQFVMSDVSCVFNLSCYDEKTEVLTDNGFKQFKNLDKTEKIATLNNNGCLEFQKPLGYHSYHRKDSMYHFSSKSIDLLVTPDHNLYVQRSHRKDWEIRKAEDCNKVSLRFKRNAKWEGVRKESFNINDKTNYHHNVKKIYKYDMKLFIEFLGYYLAEGSCNYRKQKGSYRVHIANNDPVLINRIFDVVKSMGFTPYKDCSTSHGVNFCSKIMYNYLKRFGYAHEKYIPREFKDLPVDMLTILFDSLMEGDGNTDGRTYTTTSKQLSEDFQEIALKIGFSTTLGEDRRGSPNWRMRYRISITQREKSLLTKRPEIVDYDGHVYCVEVPNHVIFVRRNGKTAWCGNCDMGGMGFIENNKALCMISVLINTHLLMAAIDQIDPPEKFFYASSACVYNADKQKNTNVTALKEEDAYPAIPEAGYGEEKLFSERMCQYFREDFKLETRSARFHNVMGPKGTYKGGREKAPAAICYKTAKAVITNNHEIEIWGDGEQKRSFMYIGDCIEGMHKIMDSDIIEPINLGSNELVSINQLVSIVEEIAGVKLKRKYKLDAPLGVRGRNSDNTKIKQLLNWEPSTPLKVGLEETYKWIYDQISRNSL